MQHYQGQNERNLSCFSCSCIRWFSLDTNSFASAYWKARFDHEVKTNFKIAEFPASIFLVGKVAKAKARLFLNVFWSSWLYFYFDGRTSLIRTPFYNGEFTLSERKQSSHNFCLVNTNTFVLQTIIPIPWVSLVKRFLCISKKKL